MAISESLKDKLLLNTGFFEGDDNYSTTAGNFDGQGLSFGIIQFNFGQGSLQPLLKEYISNYETEYNGIFGSKAATLKDVVFNKTKTEQISWGDSISDPKNKYNVISEWNTPFMSMGTKANNRALQKKHAGSYFTRAESLASLFGITTTQGLACLFDHAVHEWSFSTSDQNVANEIKENADLYYQIEGKPMPDFDRLYTVVKYTRTTDGRNRREAIRQGSGTVHGKNYRISDFGLSYNDRF